jgi:hypothetical protein
MSVMAVRPSISSLMEMLAARTPEADLLHHLVVVAEREVWQDDRDPGPEDAADGDKPEHRLTPAFAVGRQGDRPALRPDLDQQRRDQEEQSDEQLKMEDRPVDPAV